MAASCISSKVDAILPLHVPPLEEVAQVLQTYLKTQFVEASVEIVDCPDLTRPPFYLAAPGFGGNAKIVEVGGVPFLTPVPQKNKIYDLEKIVSACNSPRAFAIGPGSGPFHEIGRNSEMMANINFNETPPRINTHLSWLGENNSLVSEPYSNSTQFGFLAEFLLTDGQPKNRVLKVKAQKRTGQDDFVTCMQKALAQKYGDRPVGIGGTFLVKRGKVAIHVMPEFPPEPFKSVEQLFSWLKVFDIDAPLVCLSVFISHDPDPNLRISHTHCFSQHGQGGHYRNDVTPDTIDYEGYFVLAEQNYRIDKP